MPFDRVELSEVDGPCPPVLDDDCAETLTVAVMLHDDHSAQPGSQIARQSRLSASAATSATVSCDQATLQPSLIAHERRHLLRVGRSRLLLYGAELGEQLAAFGIAVERRRWDRRSTTTAPIDPAEHSPRSTSLAPQPETELSNRVELRARQQHEDRQTLAVPVAGCPARWRRSWTATRQHDRWSRHGRGRSLRAWPTGNPTECLVEEAESPAARRRQIQVRCAPRRRMPVRRRATVRSTPARGASSRQWSAASRVMSWLPWIDSTSARTAHPLRPCRFSTSAAAAAASPASGYRSCPSSAWLRTNNASACSNSRPRSFIKRAVSVATSSASRKSPACSSTWARLTCTSDGSMPRRRSAVSLTRKCCRAAVTSPMRPATLPRSCSMYAADAACPIARKPSRETIRSARAARASPRSIRNIARLPSVQEIEYVSRADSKIGRARLYAANASSSCPSRPRIVARWNSIFAAKRLSASRSASTSTCNAAGTSPPRYRVPDNVSIACAARSPRPARRADSIACSRYRADSSIVVTHRASSPARAATRIGHPPGMIRRRARGAACRSLPGRSGNAPPTRRPSARPSARSSHVQRSRTLCEPVGIDPSRVVPFDRSRGTVRREKRRVCTGANLGRISRARGDR